MNEAIRSSYSPVFCDLCGSDKSQVVVKKHAKSSILSDNKKVAVNLNKVECRNCGLVRDAHKFSAHWLNNLYRSDYMLNKRAGEYHFITSHGLVPRSQAFFDWIWQYLKKHRLETINQVVEVGTGAGHLLRRLNKLFPNADCFGTELSDVARQLALNNGARVIAGGIDHVEESEIDLIIAVGVLEHVPRPTRFLESIRERLAESGLLVLIQPSQDVLSSDIYFSDHLHHFATEHLARYAKKVGFTELEREVGHPLMPNFSLHIWRSSNTTNDFSSWSSTRCRDSINYYETLFQQVNHLLEDVRADESRKLAVFGLNERFALLDAYSQLGNAVIECGLSDIEPYVDVSFPVVKAERLNEFQVTDVLVCVNQIHYDQVLPRLKKQGVATHSFD
jgi:SAM-dependent methyltransferase